VACGLQERIARTFLSFSARQVCLLPKSRTEALHRKRRITLFGGANGHDCMKISFARTALICGMAGLPLWLLSYARVPYALAGRQGQFVRSTVIAGEVGAFAAGALGVGLGITAKRRSEPGSPEHRLASRGLTLGALVLALILIPNILGRFLPPF